MILLRVLRTVQQSETLRLYRNLGEVIERIARRSLREFVSIRVRKRDEVIASMLIRVIMPGFPKLRTWRYIFGPYIEPGIVL